MTRRKLALMAIAGLLAIFAVKTDVVDMKKVIMKTYKQQAE